MRHIRPLALGLALAAALPALAARPTEPFVREHAHIAAELDRIERSSDRHAALAFFRDQILPHAAWEERALYPAVDRRASKGEPFTASMRREHTIVKRWSGELPRLEGEAYARRVQQLVGLVRAHFELEEQVLLPVLDRSMTAEEFHREVHGR